MAEWSMAHAWKSDLFTRADAHQIPPTHFRSTTSPYNDVRRRVPVNHGVAPGFRGVCDTVLTQTAADLRRRTSTNVTSYGRVLLLATRRSADPFPCGTLRLLPGGAPHTLTSRRHRLRRGAFPHRRWLLRTQPRRPGRASNRWPSSSGR